MVLNIIIGKIFFNAKVRIGKQKHLADLAGFVPHHRGAMFNIVGQRHYNFDHIEKTKSI